MGEGIRWEVSTLNAKSACRPGLGEGVGTKVSVASGFLLFC